MPLTEEMRAAGWIEHDGGPCPVPARTEIEGLTRGGFKVRNIAYGLVWKDDPARIIAYRPEQPHDQ
jgi:hypothetical protein